MLCIDSTASYELYGYSGELPYKYLLLEINKCSNSTTSCDTLANVNSYMTSYLTTNNYFKVKFFIVSTIVSPSSDEPISNII